MLPSQGIHGVASHFFLFSRLSGRTATTPPTTQPHLTPQPKATTYGFSRPSLAVRAPLPDFHMTANKPLWQCLLFLTLAAFFSPLDLRQDKTVDRYVLSDLLATPSGNDRIDGCSIWMGRVSSCSPVQGIVEPMNSPPASRFIFSH